MSLSIRNLLTCALMGCISSSLNAQTWAPAAAGLPLGPQTTTGSGGSFSNYFNVTGIGPSGGSGSLFVGIGGGGVYRSDNNGASWTAVNNGLPDLFNGTTLPARAFHKNGNTILRFGTSGSWNNHGGSAIFRSTDNGATWAESSPAVLGSFVRVAEGGGRIFAGNEVSMNAPANSAGPYYSTDAGLTWNMWSSGLGVAQFAFSVNRGLVHVQDRVLAAVATLGVYASTDGGATYFPSDNDINLEGLILRAQIDLTDMVVTPGGTVYLLTRGGSWQVYRSTDAGRSWSPLGTPAAFGGVGDNSLWRLAVSGEDLIVAPSRQNGVSKMWLHRPANGWYSVAMDGFVGDGGEPNVAVHGGYVLYSTGTNLFRANLATLPLQEIAPSKLTLSGGGGVNVGVSRTLSATVDGTRPLNYQWYRDGQPISGATGSEYTFTAATGTDGGEFKLVASNSAGAITNSVTVTAYGDAPGIRDFTFRPGFGHLGTFGYSHSAGVVLSVSGGGTDVMLPLPDGRLLVGGGFNGIGNPPIAFGTPTADVTPDMVTPANSFIRLNADGSLDTTFRTGSGPNGKVRALARQADGRILVGGEFTAYNGQSVGRIVRIEADGSIDASFQAASGASSHIRSIVVQADGKILVGGAFASWDEFGFGYLVRLNADGTLDRSFRPNFPLNGEVTSVVLQPDGQILIGGAFSGITANSQTYANLIRLNPDGSLDPSFRISSYVGTVMAVQLLPDGRVVAGGLNSPYLRVYSATGALDNTFNANPGNDIFSLGVLPGGEIVAAGDERQILYGPTGTVLTNLAARPLGVSPQYWSVATLPDGRFFVGGYAGSGGGGIGKFLGSPVAQAIVASPRAIQTTNGGAAGFSVEVRGSGPFTYQWKKDGVNLSGATSATYSIPSVNASHVGNYTVAVTGPGGVMESASAGLTLLGAPTILFPPQSQFVALSRPVTLGVRALGAAPVSYQWKKNGGAISGATNASFTLAAMSLADVGSYTVDVTAAGSTVPSAAAVLTTGHLAGAVDRSFNAFYSGDGTTSGGEIADAVVQTDGKIVVASGRTSFNDRPNVRGVFRVNPDGSYDTTFAPTNTLESTAVALQPDGKVLLGFARNATVAQLYRLHPDGKVDYAFANPLLSMNGRVAHIVPLADGKILVSGSFNSVGGVARTNLVRLHADGTLDTDYSPVIPANSYIHPLPDGRVVVAYRQFTTDFTPILDVNGQLERYLGNGAWGGAIGFGNINAQVKLLPNGGFLVVNGNVGGFNAQNPVRYHPDGTLDPTWKFHFNPGGFSSSIKQTLVQPDGRILLFGEFPGSLLNTTNPASLALNRNLVRLTADGELDGTFDVFAGGTMPERALLLPDGRVFVAGYFSAWNGLTSHKLQILQGDLIEPAFYNQTTSLVLTQGNNLVLNPAPSSLGAASYQWQKNGVDLPGQTGATLNLAALGTNGSGSYTLVARSPLGTNTTTTTVTVLGAPVILAQPVPPPAVLANPFTMSVVVTGAPPFSFQWRKGGSAIGGATFASFTNASAALTDSGNYDVVVANAFGSATSSVAVVTVTTQPGALSADYSNSVGQVFHMLRQRDGKVVLGRANGPFRLNADGTADTAFNANITALVGGQAMALAPDGRLYHSANAVLHRYSSAGVRDTNFALVNNAQAITAIDVQADGRIVLGYSNAGMRRYWPDGTQDFGFTNNVTQVRTLSVLPDGRVLVTTGNGFNSGSVRRLLADGSFDPSFDNASSFNNDVLSAVPLPDGKLLLGGTFTGHNAAAGGFTSKQYVARLNANGSLDGAFTGPNFNSVFFGVQDVALQENGRIVAVGGFGTVDGLSRLGVARLEANGAHDATFDIGTGAGGANIKVQSTLVLPDGRILVAGIFTTFNGVSRNGLALLNGDVVNLGFLTEPSDQLLDVGQPLNLAVTTTATSPVSYQWFFNNAAITGATAASYSVGTTTTNQRGGYYVVASNLSGSRTSAVANVKILAAPVFLAQPVETNGYLGKFVTYAPLVEGRAPLFFQWFKGVDPVPGATNATLTLTNLQFADSGVYSLRASNNLAVVASTPVNLLVTILPGSLDLSFNASNHLDAAASVTTLPDGRIYVAGNWVSNFTYQSRFVTRLLPDGRRDPSFAQTNFNLAAAVYFRIDPKGRLLCVANNGGLYRVLPDGQLDTSWTGNNLGFNFGVAAVAFQRDGKILVGGSFTVPQQGILRLEENGQIDPTFKPGIPEAVASILVLSDDSILAGTRFNPSIKLQRFLPDGAKFPGFTNVVFGGNSVDMTRLFELPDGKFLVGGSYIGRLNRFLPDGKIDPTFLAPTVDTGAVADFAVEPNGKIVVVGSFGSWNGVAAPGLVRLLPDGAVDPGFVGGLASPVSFNSVALQYDGRILVAGGFTTFDGAARPRLAGLYGTPTSLAFTNPPLAGAFNVGGSAVLTAGAWSRTGAPLTYQWRKNGVNLPGANGPTLTLNPLQSTDAANYSVVVSDGTTSVTSPATELVVLAGPEFLAQPTSLSVTQGVSVTFRANVRGLAPLTYQWKRNGVNVPGATNLNLTLPSVSGADAGAYTLTALNPLDDATSVPAFLTVASLPAGTVDPAFATGQGANNTVYALAAAPAIDRLYAAGQFTSFDGVSGTFAKLNPDGSRGTNTIATTANTGIRYAVAALPDGRAYFGGNFNYTSDSVNNIVSRRGLARVLTNGLRDTAFTNEIDSGSVQALLVLPDESLLVGGSFNTLGGVLRTNLGRIKPDGTTDTAFGAPNFVQGGTVTAFARQSDGKILVAGSFTGVLGTARGRLARLNANGTLDTGFAAGAGANNSVDAVAVLPDGKILVGGNFTQFDGQARSYLARLNTDGSLDTAYAPTVNSSVAALAVLPDGRAYVGGNFTFVNGQSAQRFIRLNADGTTDGSFNLPGGASSTVLAILVQPDGGAIVAGGFTSIGGQSRNRLARLLGDGQLAPVIAAQPQNVAADAGDTVNFSVAAGGLNPLRFQWRFNGANLAGQTNALLTLANASTNNAGGYSVVVTNSYGAVTSVVATLSIEVIGGGGGGFSDWATSTGLTAGNNGPGDDADNDGIPNAVEYYFGSDPKGASSGLLPVAQTVSTGGQDYPAIQFIRRKSAPLVTPEIRVSSNVQFTDSLGSTTATTTDLGDGTELVTIRSNTSRAAQPAQFLQLRLTVP